MTEITEDDFTVCSEDSHNDKGGLFIETKYPHEVEQQILQALQENPKLKAEIEQVKTKLDFGSGYITQLQQENQLQNFSINKIVRYANKGVRTK